MLLKMLINLEGKSVCWLIASLGLKLPRHMLSLVDYTGIVEDDRNALTVTVRAGTPLHRISTALDKMGLAMKNLGSVAGQSIAGAISTGSYYAVVF